MGQKANYGIDAPGIVRNLTIFGVASVLVAGVAVLVLESSTPRVADTLKGFFWPGISCLAGAAYMVWSSKVGKLRARDWLLNSIAWQGDENVLDVGCGRGLLLIGAARRLSTGKAIGVDIWQKEDQSGNCPEATWANVRLEGVEDRVDIRDGDARQLPFEDNTFAVVVSSWALHNIYDVQERRQAVREVARVLKPGGRVLLQDLRHTREYVEVLRACGFIDLKRLGPRFLWCFLTYSLTGQKPSPSSGRGQP